MTLDPFEQWRMAEHAAIAAETAAAAGHGATDPAVAELAGHAKELRAKADAILLALLRSAGARSAATFRITVPFKAGDTVQPRAGGPRMKVRSLTDRYALCQWRDATGKRHVQVYRLEQLALAGESGAAPPDGEGAKPSPA